MTAEQNQDTSAFAAFVQMVADAVPVAAKDINSRRAVSDYQILTWASWKAMEGYSLSLELIAGMLGEAVPNALEVRTELARLLLSLHQARQDDYLGDRTKHGYRYRFEEPYPPAHPEWLVSGYDGRYVRSLVTEAAVQYLLASGNWERPERLWRRPGDGPTRPPQS